MLPSTVRVLFTAQLDINELMPIHFLSPALGLSSESRRILCERTSVVFHMAATLKLEANLKEAIQMNLAGTRRVMDLCHDMKNLRSVVHLSTAFCYCDQEVLLEKVYDCSHKPDDLIRCAEWMDLKSIESITEDLLKPHPNTYLYSKRLAEQLVRDEHPKLPICIARPSIGEFEIWGWIKRR